MWEENRESGRGTARRGEVLSNTRTVKEGCKVFPAGVLK
jgi:hypothetical protein